MNENEKVEMISNFESLVDELLKTEPEENLVQSLMQRLDIPYSQDSVARISEVLEQMNKVIFEDTKEKGEYDLQ